MGFFLNENSGPETERRSEFEVSATVGKTPETHHHDVHTSSVPEDRCLAKRDRRFYNLAVE